MDSILEITRLALGNERLRAEISAMNIARANTPISPENIGVDNFSHLLSGKEISSGENIKISQTNNSIKFLYEPQSSYANESGFVAYPDIDLASEFVKLTLSKRAYEANVRVFNTASKMHAKSLEIGKV